MGTDRYPELKRLFEDSLGRPAETVDLGKEVFDIAEGIRYRALKMEDMIMREYRESISRGYSMNIDIVELMQPVYGLKSLYQEMTGYVPEEFWDQSKERQIKKEPTKGED